MNTLAQSTPTPKPWWRHGMVWFVLSGPLLVVVAAIYTAYIAIHGADLVLSTAPVDEAIKQPAQTPAMMARNHAATPEADVPLARPNQPK